MPLARVACRVLAGYWPAAALMTLCARTDVPPARWADVGHGCAAGAPAEALPAAARDSLEPLVGDAARTDRLIRDLPGGWGGEFFDAGRPTIYLTAPERA